MLKMLAAMREQERIARPYAVPSKADYAAY